MLIRASSVFSLNSLILFGLLSLFSRGPSQFGSSHEEGMKSAYPRPFRGRGGKPPLRNSQFKRDDISALNEDMKKVYL